MNIERVKTLITFLRNLAPEKFYYGDTVKEHANGCGTVCCAFGWLPVVFPEHFEYRSPGYSKRPLVFERGRRYEGYRGIHLTSNEFFGVTGETAVDWFVGNHPVSITAKELADYIEASLAGWIESQAEVGKGS